MAVSRSSVPPRPLRRLAARLTAVALAKIGVLLLIWWAARPPVPPDTRPEAVARHLAPASTPTDEGRP